MSGKTQKPFNVLDADMRVDEFVHSMDEKYFQILFCPNLENSGSSLDEIPRMTDKLGRKVKNHLGH